MLQLMSTFGVLPKVLYHLLHHLFIDCYYHADLTQQCCSFHAPLDRFPQIHASRCISYSVQHKENGSAHRPKIVHAAMPYIFQAAFMPHLSCHICHATSVMHLTRAILTVTYVWHHDVHGIL